MEVVFFAIPKLFPQTVATHVLTVLFFLFEKELYAHMPCISILQEFDLLIFLPSLPRFLSLCISLSLAGN
jgi:hypothetical protein